MRNKRIQRVNQLIKRELNQIILKEVEFPEKTLVTITRVGSTPNLIQANVWVSVIPEEKSKDIVRILNRQIYDIQQIINKRLRMRPVPKIRFLEEKETIKAGRIEAILEEIKRAEKD